MTYAVIRTGGKQYRVAPGQQLRVDRLPGSAGDRIELPDVLLLSTDDGAQVGAPTLANARVVASIVEQGRGRKISVFKYKPKVRYRVLRGHRQLHTDLRIEEIVGPDGAAFVHEKKDAPTQEPPPEPASEAEDELVTEDAEAEEELEDEVDADEDTIDEVEDDADEDTDDEEQEDD